jgi:uncharacterized protein YbjT (DUF2867 family)
MNEPSNLAQTVAVTGGTGFVGRRIIETLLTRGITVRALVRSIEKANRVLPTDRIEDSSITLCQGTLDDPDALRHLVEGCEACIHLVGIIRETRGSTFQNVHVDGTRAITQACIQSNPAMRYIHMSALGIGPDKRAKYRDSKHRAEQIVRNSKLESTIIRPGLIHGPQGEFTQMAIDWVLGKAPPYVFLPYFSRWKSAGLGFEAPSVAPVYVDDVAHIFVDAISMPNTIGQVYDLAGSQQLPFPEMLRTYARHLDPPPKEKPAVGLPWFVAAFQARIARWVGLGGLLPYDEGMAIMGGRDSVSDNAQVIADFGFTPAEFESALGMYADQL